MTMRDSGTLFICSLVNVADRGLMPKEVLHKVSKYWFEKRTIGISRFYEAKGVNEQVDLLVRIPPDNNIEIGQYVVLGNGDQYRITMVNHGHDVWEYTRMKKTDFINGYQTSRITGLDWTELTLMKVENYYDIEVDED